MQPRILYVAYPLAPVGPDTGGGSEQITFLLEQEMNRRGYRTAMAACCGSQSRGELVDTGAPATDFEQLGQRRSFQNEVVLKTIAVWQSTSRRLAIVHDHGGNLAEQAKRLPVPVLMTLHLPRAWYPEGQFEHIPDNLFFNCVSDTQLQQFRDVPRLLGYIRNGIPIETFTFRPKKAAYCLWLGRICFEKAPHLAMDVAEMAGMSLIVAGSTRLYSRHQKYFDAELTHRFGQSGRFKLFDNPTFQDKVQLLSHARVLIVPSLFDETSSLVSIEAMACGTPVVAFRRGALPETVIHGMTGFVVDTIEEMVSAVEHIDFINPHMCRSHALQHHSSVDMATCYEALYRKISRGGNSTI